MEISPAYYSGYSTLCTYWSLNASFNNTDCRHSSTAEGCTLLDWWYSNDTNTALVTINTLVWWMQSPLDSLRAGSYFSFTDQLDTDYWYENWTLTLTQVATVHLLNRYSGERRNRDCWELEVWELAKRESLPAACPYPLPAMSCGHVGTRDPFKVQ